MQAARRPGQDRIPVYASDGYLTDDPDNQLEAQLERIADKGFPGAKFKIGMSPKSDEERVRWPATSWARRRCCWSTSTATTPLDQALESMRRTAPYGIHFYEEPLPPQDFEATRRWRGARRSRSRPARRCTPCWISRA